MIYLKFSILPLIIFIFFSCSNSKKVTWKVMKDVTFEKVFSEEFQGHYLVPKFGKKISFLNEKKVQIKGYIISADTTQGIYVLSSTPFIVSSCRVPDLEKVMEVQVKGKQNELKLNQIITFEGKLILNSDDIYHLNYILEAATVIK